MVRASVMAMALVASLTGNEAQAAGWSDFDSAFPSFPCQDGWMACKVNGEVISPDLKSGDNGVPIVANARVDWFSLTPTSTFSPFVGLTNYTGELPPAAPEPAPVAPAPEPVAAAAPPPTAPVPAAPAPMTRPDSQPPAPMTRPEPSSSAMVRPEPSGGAMVRPEPSGGTMVRPEPSGSAMVRPEPAPEGPPEGAPVQAMVAPPPAPMTKPESVGIQVAAAPAAPAAADDDCSNLLRLEPPAMMGKLTPGQNQCLESAYSAAAKQTDKDDISRLLLANAKAKRDMRTWEKLMKRHLDEVSQSDPNICFQYASFLAKKGPGRSQSVIKWSDVALENRSAWTGSTHVSRVYTLYKLRALAGQALWIKAEEDFVASPGDETKKQVESTRNMTKVYSREWYEYAKQSGKDVTSALQLCTSAAGTKDYCEAG